MNKIIVRTKVGKVVVQGPQLSPNAQRKFQIGCVINSQFMLVGEGGYRPADPGIRGSVHHQGNHIQFPFTLPTRLKGNSILAGSHR